MAVAIVDEAAEERDDLTGLPAGEFGHSEEEKSEVESEPEAKSSDERVEEADGTTDLKEKMANVMRKVRDGRTSKKLK